MLVTLLFSPQHKAGEGRGGGSGGDGQAFCRYRDTAVLPCQQEKVYGTPGVKKAVLEVGRQLERFGLL